MCEGKRGQSFFLVLGKSFIAVRPLSMYNRLAAIKDSPRTMDPKMMQDFQKAWTKMTSETNENVVTFFFLNVTFDPFTGTYKPFTEPNDDTHMIIPITHQKLSTTFCMSSTEGKVKG